MRKRVRLQALGTLDITFQGESKIYPLLCDDQMDVEVIDLIRLHTDAPQLLIIAKRDRTARLRQLKWFLVTRYKEIRRKIM